MGKGGRSRQGGKRKPGGGKGKGRKRKRNAWADASDNEGENSGKGSRGGKGGKGKKTPDGDEPVRRAFPVPGEPAPAHLPSRPGFNSLLQSLGCADEAPVSSGEDDDDEEDEDEQEAADEDANDDGKSAAAALRNGKAEKLASKSVSKRHREEAEEDVEQDAGEDDEQEQQEEEDEDIEDNDENGEDVVIDGDGAADNQGDAKDSGADFYSCFWHDPPGQLAIGDSKPTELGDASAQKFELPGLSRCESKRRNLTSLQAFLRTSEAQDAWRHCGLSPGLKAAFEAYLSNEQLETGAEEAALFLFLHAYVDVAFPQHSHTNGRLVRAMYMLHVVDHVLKASTEVVANNAVINKAKRIACLDGGAGVQDKGFTRARVLILCPFKSTCHELVQLLLAFCPTKREIANKSRFEEEFGPEEDADDETKPPDYRYLFSGNNDDSFRLGIAVSKKQVRLYSPFHSSDILICSPLGMRKITGAEGDKKREFDFLSSIEVCVVDRADALRMQNWEHVMEVLQVVNRRPQALQDIDISRLRPAFSDGRARAFRQTIVTSLGESLDANAVFTTGCSAPSTPGKPKIASNALAQKFGIGANRSGKRKRALDSDEENEEEDVVRHNKLLGPSEAVDIQGLRGFVRLASAPEGGPMQQATALGISRQFFLHVQCKSLQEQSDRLFEAFESKYWKPLGSSLERLLIVVPSYLGFLRLRRFLRESGASFCSAFEYADPKAVSKARFDFNRGDRRVLLVTERFLWYRRFKLKGADYVLFYGPPETAQIYEETLSNTRTPSQCNSMCLFTKYDALALERLVGHTRGSKMLASEPGKVFVYS